MTKQEWLDCKAVTQLINQTTNKRKKQLISLASCRSIEHLTQNQQSKDLLNKFELFIDGKITISEINEVTIRYKKESFLLWDTILHPTTHARAVHAVSSVVDTCHYALHSARCAVNFSSEELSKQIDIIKDIFNPFLLNLKFPTKAIQLAEEIYESNNTTTRLVLSDFLEEFHFPEELYLHLKQPNHYKGCWVIDQILEKTS